MKVKETDFSVLAIGESKQFPKRAVLTALAAR
jgi:hypothetical protein